VLPPVRGTARESAAAASASPGRSVIAESPRPMSLQRMFEQFQRAPDPTVATESASPTVQRAPVDGGAATTITFDSPVVQREPEGEAAAAAPGANAEPAARGALPAAAAGAAPGGSGGGRGAGGDVDELVNRLYDPLAARLRAELWLDRERAGVLMDLHR
jgi:hypothetical protein